MRWVIHGVGLATCRIADNLRSCVYPVAPGEWVAYVGTGSSEDDVWASRGHATEAAAKAAVCHWIGKTMAQFSNALAAGCNEVPDDGN